MAKKQIVATDRVHVFYSGRVQGVGFRYTVESLAHEAGVFGWVKNLSNGSVEVVAEGTKENIQALLEAIQKSLLGPHIKKADVSWEKPTNQFSDFTVEFHF